MFSYNFGGHCNFHVFFDDFLVWQCLLLLKAMCVDLMAGAIENNVFSKKKTFLKIVFFVKTMEFHKKILKSRPLFLVHPPMENCDFLFHLKNLKKAFSFF